MKKFKLLIAAILFVIISNAQITNWGFDTSHSNVRFAVSHMVISEVEGNFSSFDGTVTASKPDFSDAEIEFSIDVSSIDTDNKNRDEHLLNEDFFDVTKFPTIDFKSKSLKRVTKDKFKLTGDLSMHGVTKEITVDVKYGGTITDPWGNTKAGFKITGVLDRTSWGLVYNSTLDTGGLMIGEEITIVCNIELIKL